MLFQFERNAKQGRGAKAFGQLSIKLPIEKGVRRADH